VPILLLKYLIKNSPISFAAKCVYYIIIPVVVTVFVVLYE
jgi:hypothetical protein